MSILRLKLLENISWSNASLSFASVGHPSERTVMEAVTPWQSFSLCSLLFGCKSSLRPHWFFGLLRLTKYLSLEEKRCFQWMDALTKLSIIKIPTMLLAVAVLFVYIGGSGQEFYNSEDLYAMTLVVVPKAGFYCIVIAQHLS
jgi:hypothetical protein